MFDPLGIEQDNSWGVASAWDGVLKFVSQTFESSSGTRKDRSSSARGVAGVKYSHILYLSVTYDLINGCCLSLFLILLVLN